MVIRYVVAEYILWRKDGVYSEEYYMLVGYLHFEDAVRRIVT